MYIPFKIGHKNHCPQEIPVAKKNLFTMIVQWIIKQHNGGTTKLFLTLNEMKASTLY